MKVCGIRALRSRVVLALLMAATTVSAQPASNFDLSNLRVKMKNGKEAVGRLISASGDSLVMRGKTTLVHDLGPGCEVAFRLWRVNVDYSGTVEGVTDSTLAVRLRGKQEVHVLDRKSIEFLQVTKRAGSVRGVEGVVVIRASDISSILMHRKGSGAIGAVLGGLVGIVFGTVFSGSLSQASTGAYLGLFIGSALGAAAGSSGGEYLIDGSQEKFEAWVSLIHKKKASLEAKN